MYYHQADDDDDEDGEEEDYSVKTFSVPGMVPLQDILLQDTDTHTLNFSVTKLHYDLRFTVSIVADGKSHNINKLHEAAQWDFNIKHTHTHTHLSGDLSDAEVSQVAMQDPNVQRLDNILCGTGLQCPPPIRGHEEFDAILLLL